MPDQLVHSLSATHEVLDQFLAKRFLNLTNYAVDDQRKAALRVWARYGVALKALHQLRNGRSPDYITIARVCLEMEASLRAFLKDETLGTLYLADAKSGHGRYFKAVRESGSIEDIAQAEREMVRLYGEDFDHKPSSDWYPRKRTGLIREHGLDGDRVFYAAFCEVAHGSAVGVDFLNQEGLRGMWSGDTLVSMFITRFIRVTKDFLDKLWGPLWTPAQLEISKEFDLVMDELVQGLRSAE